MIGVFILRYQSKARAVSHFETLCLKADALERNGISDRKTKINKTFSANKENHVSPDGRWRNFISK
jgi:hypothetical protein